ncbi:hypothetical protein ACS0TY_028954 [Phlomoides rotata]
MDSSFRKLSLLDEEDEELVLVPDSHESTGLGIDLSMVGRFLTDQPINFGIMKSRMATLWKPKKCVSMKEIDEGRYIIQFYHNLDMKRVKEGAPWFFGNHLLILHQLKTWELPLAVPLNFLCFWVQIYGLPVGYFSDSIGSTLGNFVGNFIEYDASNTTADWREYMRVRVEIDVDQPLKRCKKIKLGMGPAIMVTFKYEKLSKFCFICGRLDHTESFCDVLFNSEGGNVKREWGVFLKAPDRRMPLLSGDKWLRKEGWKLQTNSLGTVIKEVVGNPIFDPSNGGQNEEHEFSVLNDSKKRKIRTVAGQLLLEVDAAGMFLMVGWSVWKGRNGMVWEGKQPNSYRVVRDAAVLFQEWAAARRIFLKRDSSDACPKWHKPEGGWAKINVDAAVFSETNEIGLGMVVRDDLGRFVVGRSVVFPGMYTPADA